MSGQQVAGQPGHCRAGLPPCSDPAAWWPCRIDAPLRTGILTLSSFVEHPGSSQRGALHHRELLLPLILSLPSWREFLGISQTWPSAVTHICQRQLLILPRDTEGCAGVFGLGRAVSCPGSVPGEGLSLWTLSSFVLFPSRLRPSPTFPKPSIPSPVLRPPHLGSTFSAAPGREGACRAAANVVILQGFWFEFYSITHQPYWI